MDLQKEKITTLLHNFFLLNELDDNVLKYKKQLKDIKNIKLDLVGIIKESEGLYKEIEQLNQGEGKMQIQTTQQSLQGNDNGNNSNGNNTTTAFASNIIKKKDIGNISRPRTPDFKTQNTTHHKTALNFKSSTKEQQQNNQSNNNHSDDLSKTFNQPITKKSQMINGYKDIDRAPTPSVLQMKKRRDINKTNANMNKSVDLTASGTIEAVGNTPNAKNNKAIVNNSTNKRPIGNQGTTQTGDKGNNKKKTDRPVTPVNSNKNNNIKKNNKQNGPFSIEESKEDLLLLEQKHEKALKEYIIQRKSSYYKFKNSSPMIHALQLCIRSNYLSFKEKYSLIISKSKELYTINRDLIHEQLHLIKVIKEKRIAELKDQISKYDINIIDKKFCPSKTATNGLNFVTKEEEGNLWKKQQPPQIINIFKSMFLMFNESYDSIEENDLIQIFITQITPKHGCETLKALLVNKLGKTIESSPESIVKLINFSNNNPTLFSATELIKINRSVSYMNFIIKEYFDYLTLKLHDGVYVYSMRLIAIEKDALQEKVSCLNALLSSS